MDPIIHRIWLERCMDLFACAKVGFSQLEVPESLRMKAQKNLELWLTSEEFVTYRPQIEWLIQKGDFSGLLDRFFQILPFGTGGRRGAVGIGPNRMNLWTLGASVQGHSDYLKQKFPGKKDITVCLAYDVREFRDKNGRYSKDLPNPILGLSSRDFAHHAAKIYAANGIVSYVLSPTSHSFYATPELSLAIRRFGAQGGLNISASHNPPDDNGGKFYEERGAQPVPPDDQVMADLVENIDRIRIMGWNEALALGLIRYFDESAHRAYLDLCLKGALIDPPQKSLKGQSAFKIVFTPLHGVGSLTAMEILQKRGFEVIPVVEQMAPDGQFPNVTKSPNPEVPESLDRAEVVALAHRADLVLATDPDADRLGGLYPGPDGNWHFLNGQRMAALMTWFKLAKLQEQGRLEHKAVVVKTEVTTRQISKITADFKVQLVGDLLVGFKYIADVIYQLEMTGRFGDVLAAPTDYIIGTEESHGAMVSHQIRDKDAGGAALLLAECALDLKRRGSSIFRQLEELACQHGYFNNIGINILLPGLDGRLKMEKMLDSLRLDPPLRIAGLNVSRFEDLRNPEGKFGPIKGATDASSRNVLVFELGDNARAVLRPSGTEPKAKIYIEASSLPRLSSQTDDEWNQIKAGVDAIAKEIGKDLTKQALVRVGL
ncbi:MAG: phospho-sugar mutase [Planctomycetota bacterium]|nr:MAG: phospho-sugar mutase [Planctomycetota bacterium]